MQRDRVREAEKWKSRVTERRRQRGRGQAVEIQRPRGGEAGIYILLKSSQEDFKNSNVVDHC